MYQPDPISYQSDKLKDKFLLPTTYLLFKLNLGTKTNFKKHNINTFITPIKI